MANEILLLSERHESGEVRVFLPDFVGSLHQSGWTVFLDQDYGSQLGFNKIEYESVGGTFSHLNGNNPPTIMALRYPSDEFVDALPPNSNLICMLHFPTRPDRVEKLKQKNINAIALDQIKNERGERLVENLKAVSWNGMYAGFSALAEQAPDLKEVNVVILGSGNIGRHAVDASIHHGNTQCIFKPAVQVTTLGRQATSDNEILTRTLTSADILVDATERNDTSRPIIFNKDLAALPKHAIIVDLCVDPYAVNGGYIVSTKGIEGIPQGNLNRYIIKPSDPEWMEIPNQIDQRVKRTVASCYSWPGIFPEECMKVYGRQLVPLLKVLSEKSCDELSISGGYYESALFRGTLKHFLEEKNKN